MTQKLIWLAITGRLPCIFNEMTGLYCPGCGGTRAIKALIQGRPLLSFLYHPLVLYCALVAMIFAISYLLYWKTRKSKFRLYLGNGYVYVGLGILAVNFLVKNYFLIVKNIDLLAMLPTV